MYALFQLIDTVISIYTWVVFAYVITSWLIQFNVVNTRNRVVFHVADILNRLTEPALRPIRKLIPAIGGMDLSPVVLFLVLIFIRNLIVVDLARSVM